MEDCFILVETFSLLTLKNEFFSLSKQNNILKTNKMSDKNKKEIINIDQKMEKKTYGHNKRNGAWGKKDKKEN